ncbi:MAG: hypothetical protein JSW65_01275, partial [Candidatus Bipolaricaulota bacterium]
TFAALGTDCYEDLVIRGAGASTVNGVLSFEGMMSVEPSYRNPDREGDWIKGDLCPWVFKAGGKWVIAQYEPFSPYLHGATLYFVFADTPTPPRAGWEVGTFGRSPAPTISGGYPCIELVPAGLAGFLDRGWPEGEEPPAGEDPWRLLLNYLGSPDRDWPEGGDRWRLLLNYLMAYLGELVVSATYEVGELITGCCRVEAGGPIELPYVTMTFYRATIAKDFDVREPLLAKLLPHDSKTASYCFSIATADLDPGFYDIRLGLPSFDHQWIRVEVVAPSE